MTSPNREIRQHTSPHLARVISVVPLPHVGSRTGFSWILVLGSLEELESHNHLALLDFSAPPPPCPPNQLDNHSFTAQILSRNLLRSTGIATEIYSPPHSPFVRNL